MVLVNGYDATLKKFSKQGDFVVLEPMSNDPSFQTQIYTKDTPIKIIGKYIGKFEELKISCNRLILFYGGIMAKKTNFKSNGNEYFRVSKTIGHRADGTPIENNFTVQE